MTDYPTPEGERIITTAPMSLERAREVLEQAGFIPEDNGTLWHKDDGGVGSTVGYVWKPPSPSASLELDLTADQLEALAVWMRAHTK